MLKWVWGKGNLHSLFVGLQTNEVMEISVENSPKKLKLNLPYDQIYYCLSYIIDTLSAVFIAALVTTATNWKQSKHPLTNKWIMRM